MRSEIPLRTPHADALLAHDGWLRALISRLVADHQVDDVLQDTWVAALERPPAPGASPRAWLARVARRLAFRTRRGEDRRRRREHAVARDDHGVSGDEIVQRIELRQLVTRAVLQLEEPYRSTLLQRFYESRTPRQIARQYGVPAATIRSRLHRALRLLRESLAKQTDSASRGGASLLTMALAIPRRGVSAGTQASAALEALLMTTKLKTCVGLAAALLLVGGLAVILWTGPPPDAVHATAMTEAEDSIRLAGTVAGSQAEETERIPLAPAPAVGDPASREPSIMVIVTGHVLDPHGRPLAGVDLYRRGTASERGPGAGSDRTAFESVAGDWKRLGQSAVDGSFKSLVSEDGWLAVGPPYIAVRTWPLDSGIYTDCVVVAAPAVAISGVVTDSEGHELAGVEISGFCERMPSYPDVLDHNGRPEFLGGETDSRGRFSIGRVPGCSAVVFSFAKPGYEKAELSCPTFDRSDYHLELRHPGQPGDHVFEGHVYDSDGVPVTDAMVGYGSTQATTDERGRYRFAVASLDEDEVLFAAKEGFLSAKSDIAAAREGNTRTHVHDLRLRTPTAVIAGSVLRANGEPWPGIQVYLWDVGYLGSTGFTVECSRIGDGNWIGISARTDSSGGFELKGLDDRPYRLRLFDESIPFGWTTEPIRAGRRDVELRVPAEALREEVRGRLVDSLGRGVEGARVRYRVDRRMRDGHGVFTTGGGAVTGASGEFVLERVPSQNALLLVDGDAIMPTSQSLESSAPSTGVRITVHRRGKLRVEAPQAPTGAEFVVLDAQGQRLTIRQFMHQGYITRDHWPLSDGRSQVLTVSDRARTVVLRHDGKELGRRDLTLWPGAVTEIRF